MKVDVGSVGISLLMLAVLSACGDGREAPATGGKGKEKSAHLVETMTVQTRTFDHATEHTGSLRALRTTRIFNLEEGRILGLTVFEGDRVTKNQVLVTLDDALLQAELQKAVAARAQAALDTKRLEGLAQKNIESQNQLEKARTQLAMAQAEENVLTTRLGYTLIKAPFAGIVSERLVQQGDVVAKHTHLLTLYDPSSLITELRVSELILPLLKVGDPVDVVVDALGAGVYPGVITRIHPTVDDKTRRGVVEVEMKSDPVGVMAGQLCRITLRTHFQDRLVIPFAVLQRDLESEYVYVVDAQSQAQKRRVTSGLRLDDNVEISHGLEAGEKLVVRGFFGLRAGATVSEVSAKQ